MVINLFLNMETLEKLRQKISSKLQEIKERDNQQILRIALIRLKANPNFPHKSNCPKENGLSPVVPMLGYDPRGKNKFGLLVACNDCNQVDRIRRG